VALPNVGDAPDSELPRQFALHPSYPNPFNPSTRISFDLPRPERVTLKIYDLTGRLVRVLVDEDSLPAGRHEATWQGRDDHGRKVAAGVYLYRLEAGTYQHSRSMTLVK
jgi:flagellar hook assembly protein FlgD